MGECTTEVTVSLLAGAELTKVVSLPSCAAFGNGSGKPRKMT